MPFRVESVTFHPAGPLERLPDGRIRFPNGGSVEYKGVERRVDPGDELVLFWNGEKMMLMINGVAIDEIGLDS